MGFVNLPVSRKYKFHNNDVCISYHVPQALPARLKHSGGDRYFYKKRYKEVIIDSQVLILPF